jgi:hypothetical protein
MPSSDLLDTDALRLEQINALLERLPADARDGLRHVDMLILRQVDGSRTAANDFEADLPRTFRFLEDRQSRHDRMTC